MTGDEAVIEHDVRLFERMHSAERDEFGISGAGSDEPCPSLYSHSLGLLPGVVVFLRPAPGPLAEQRLDLPLLGRLLLLRAFFASPLLS